MEIIEVQVPQNGTQVQITTLVKTTNGCLLWQVPTIGLELRFSTRQQFLELPTKSPLSEASRHWLGACVHMLERGVWTVQKT